MDTNKKDVIKKPVNRKALFGIIAVIVLVLGVAGGSIAIARNSPERRLDKALELGDKYLDELDYERALATYKQALEIEPKDMDAYRGALLASEGLGDREGMAAIFADAQAALGSMTEEERRSVLDAAVELCLCAARVYPDDHEAIAGALERGFDALDGDERIGRELLREYGILAEMYIKTGDLEKEQAVYQKLLDRNLENAAGLADWPKEAGERFQEYLRKNGGLSAASGGSAAKPTSEPAAESTPEPARYVEELFTVSNTEYESYANAYGGSMPVKKNGKWGAVNSKNEVIVPFEYDGFIASADSAGRFVLKKAEEYFLFDNEGRVIYQGKDYVRASGGMYITWKNTEDWAGASAGLVEYHRMDGSVQASLFIGHDYWDGWAPPSYVPTELGFYDGVCYVYGNMEEEAAAIENRSESVYQYTRPRMDTASGIMDLQGNVTWPAAPGYAEYWEKADEWEGKLRKQEEEHEALRQQGGMSFNNILDGLGWFSGPAPISTLNHGYSVFADYDYLPEDDDRYTLALTVYDKDYQKVARIRYENLKLDNDGRVILDGSSWDDEAAWRGYFIDGMRFYHYGSKMVFLVGGKEVLMDFARNTRGAEEVLNPDEMVLAVYDYIQMADEKYWLVQSGKKRGYIDHEGREMAMFEYASDFVNGYALVTEDGKAYIINEEFEKVQELGAADAVAALGENFLVASGEQYHFYGLTNR